VKTIVAIISPLLLFGTQLSTAKPIAPIPICEVLQNLAKYRNSVIEIRGEWNGGSLTGRCVPLKTGDYTWPTYITLEFPEDLSRLPEEKVDWGLDHQAWSLAEAKLSSLLDQIITSRTSSLEVVSATVKGRLDTPEHLSPGSPPNGFGHLNQFPARMVLMEISDVARTNIADLPNSSR
jgi:hypothetical protein